MSEISVRLKDNRPELSASTLKTYTSILNSLYKRVFGSDDFKMKNFEKWEDIIKDLKDKPVSSRKTALSALFVLTGLQKYNELMRENIAEYKEGVDTREMNDKQKEAFKTQDEIKEIVEVHRKRAELLYKKANRNVRDIQDIQDYIILCLVSGLYIPPRRAEWTKFKVANENRDTDNYINSGKEFVFNTFKGSEKKGTQVIPIPLPLKRILKKWLLINPTDWLLFDVKGDALNATKLNQRLTKIFGKGFSINGLRHSYLSSKYQDTIKLNEEMAKDFEEMGSSKGQEKIYIKKLD
jgi:hypothetical protein